MFGGSCHRMMSISLHRHPLVWFSLMDGVWLDQQISTHPLMVADVMVLDVQRVHQPSGLLLLEPLAHPHPFLSSLQTLANERAERTSIVAKFSSRFSRVGAFHHSWRTFTQASRTKSRASPMTAGPAPGASERWSIDFMQIIFRSWFQFLGGEGAHHSRALNLSLKNVRTLWNTLYSPWLCGHWLWGGWLGLWAVERAFLIMNGKAHQLTY